MQKTNSLVTNSNIKSENYTYELKDAVEIGKGVVQVKVIGGKYDGKVAVVIKMPDDFSGFFPTIFDSKQEEQMPLGFFNRLFRHNKSLERNI